MPDLTQNQPQPASGEAPDPIRALHKMSTTAGLGTTDYVAINGAAVTSLILGVASWLATFANVLLVIPLVAILFGIAGLRQISQSNGTQGGRIIAIGGILLALLIGGWIVGQQVKESMGHQADQQQLVELIGQLDAAVKAGDADKAKSLFTPEFQTRVNPDKFTNTVKQISQNQVYGNLDSITWNKVPFQFEQAPDAKSRYASGTVLMKWTQVRDTERVETVFRNDGDGWHIMNIPRFFSDK
jgi:hypothetical protein